ncbi:BICD family-like cargo adapter 2 isoform X2 [Alligator mississippiensis]|uniref:BICD family-like cargo adapter 2 isoform X2 n=1 Tax=Alligator mississippiensis TaxID=8496 RepID=UPI0028777970|nr:BICD family-like cargo adapter 2 isoform X2 [Alligator mississippiensis]
MGGGGVRRLQGEQDLLFPAAGAGVWSGSGVQGVGLGGGPAPSAPGVGIGKSTASLHRSCCREATRPAQLSPPPPVSHPPSCPLPYQPGANPKLQTPPPPSPKSPGIWVPYPPPPPGRNPGVLPPPPIPSPLVREGTQGSGHPTASLPLPLSQVEPRHLAPAPLQSPGRTPGVWAPPTMALWEDGEEGGAPGGEPGGGPRLARVERDLALAAELGQLLLAANEELRRQQEAQDHDHAQALERLERENQELRVALAAARAEGEGRAAELEAELAVLQAPPRRPSPAPALDPAPLEWAEQNQRLAEELQEALERERGLRAELASLREETRAQGRSQAELEAAAQSLSAEAESLRAEAEELRGANRRLRRRIRAVSEELQFQSADNGVSLKAELEGTQGPEHPKAPARDRSEALPQDALEEKEVEIERLQDELAVQQGVLQAVREELGAQRRLLQERDGDAALRQALAQRNTAIDRQGVLAETLERVTRERDALSRQVLAAAHQKWALSRELEAWQDDMQFVIHRQLQAQWQQEAGAPPPVRRGNSAPHGGHFLSFFRRS